MEQKPGLEAFVMNEFNALESREASLNGNDHDFSVDYNFIDKYAWVKPLKYKKCEKLLDAFIEIVNESNRKPFKLWVDRGKEIYNKVMQEWLDNSYSLLFATHNEGMSVIAERFRKTSKSKIYKRITADNSKSYLPYLNKLVDEYNNISLYQ